MTHVAYTVFVGQHWLIASLNAARPEQENQNPRSCWERLSGLALQAPKVMPKVRDGLADLNEVCHHASFNSPLTDSVPCTLNGSRLMNPRNAVRTVQF